MRGGNLDRLVRVERRVLGTPEYDPATGEPNYEWVTDGEKVAAEKKDRRASERFSAGASQVVADVETVFRLRWHPYGLVMQPDTYRIVYPIAPRPERVWNIVGVAEIGRAEGLEVACAARAEGPVT